MGKITLIEMSDEEHEALLERAKDLPVIAVAEPAPCVWTVQKGAHYEGFGVEGVFKTKEGAIKRAKSLMERDPQNWVDIDDPEYTDPNHFGWDGDFDTIIIKYREVEE